MIYSEFKKKEIKQVVSSGKQLLQQLVESIRPDFTTTGDIEIMARGIVHYIGAKSSYYGCGLRSLDEKSVITYPFYTCISINEEVVYGIPDMNRIIKTDDLVKIDIGINRGFHADLSTTIWAGNTEEHPLIVAANEAMESAMEICKDGCPIREIAIAIETTAMKHNVFVADVLTGHGVGRKLNEEPMVPNSTRSTCIGELKAGMVLSIEPIVCEGGSGIELHPNRVTILTRSHGLSAHVGKMVYITKDGCEALS